MTPAQLLSFTTIDGVARRYHERNCSTFDGRRTVPAPRYKDKHRAHHLFWVSLILRDTACEMGMSWGQAKELADASLSEVTAL